MTLRYDPRVRLNVNNTWEDVTRDRTGSGDGVRVESGIQIFHGQQNESGKPNPATCKMTFGNKSGYFTPRNPTGPFAGYLNVNTPVCVLLDEVTDTFSRVVANGWGTADTGEVYSTAGLGTVLASDWNVAGGVGTHFIPQVSAFRTSFFASTSTCPSARNVVQKIRVTLPFTDVTGGALEPANLLCRVFDANNHYMARLVINTDESVTLALMRGNSTTIASAVVVPGVTHVAGQGIWVMLGAFENDIYATAWVGDAPENEPTSWLVHAVDTTSFNEFGRFGVRSGVAAGNTNIPVTFSYDSYTAWVGVFSGEIPDFNGEFTDDAGDAVIAIEAAGITRRLTEGGKTALNSSARRWYEDFAFDLPDWYWPLDDGELSLQGRATRTPTGFGPTDVVFEFNYALATDPNSANEKHFSQAKLAPWMPNGVTLLPDNVFFQVVMPDGTGYTGADASTPGNWAIEWGWKGGTNTQTTFLIAGEFAPGITEGGLGVGAWSIALDQSTHSLVVTMDLAGHTVSVDTNTTYSLIGINIFDGRFHQFFLNVRLTGADPGFFLDVDGQPVTSGVNPGRNMLARISGFWFNNSNINAEPKEVGVAHVALFLTNDPITNEEVTWGRISGFPGEGAKSRFARLCNEESVQNFIDFIPDPGGMAMGPQYTDPLMAQLFEIMSTDGGMLLEMQDSRSLDYKTLTELRALTTSLTLDVSLGHVAPPFKPVDDTQQLRNKIRASKRDGGDYTFQQETGRLSVANPENGGSGVYTGSDVKANPDLEGDLQNIAQREVSRGTVDKARYPEITVNLATPAIAASVSLRRSILDTLVGKRMKLTGMTEQNIYEDANLLTLGMTRFLTNYEHAITWNTMPSESFDIFHVETVGSILGTDSSTIVYGIDNDDTAVQISTEGKSLWTTSAGSMPILGRLTVPPANNMGEDISITNITTTAPGFRSVGTATHADNASTVPGLPAGAVTADTLILVTVIRNTAAAANLPAGWTSLHSSGHLRIAAAPGNTAAPTCTYSGGAVGDTTSSVLMAFTNMPFDYTNALVITGAANVSAQDIVMPAIVQTRSNGIEIMIGWKQDDYTSAAPPIGYTEIGEFSTVTGNDQSLYAAYRLVATRDESPIQTVAVTGGASAISKGFMLYFTNPQAATIVRSRNQVVRSWPANTPIRIAYPKPLG
jgi:hypothetical protein